MRERVEFFFFQFLKRLVLALPLRSAQRFGVLIGRAAYHVIASRRRVALDNLAHAFPEKNRQELIAIAKGAFSNYGIAMMEFLWFPRLDERTVRALVRPKNIEMMVDGHAKGKGMVMLSGHFGNWELIAFAGAYLGKQRFTIIVQTQSNRSIDRVINRHRCLLGNRVVPMGMSIREIITTLRTGGIVAIAPDQSGPIEGAFVDFFGRRVATHQGPAVFSLRTGAPIQMGFLIRQKDGTYDAVFEEVPSSDLTGDSEENIIELTRRHTALLERYIRRYPDHWLWMHRRWKHTWESVQREKQEMSETGG
ncbi:MAG: lysophospholipid acyltransferase family protein [Ignavibacteria bacterium]|nr:lysophospholipid acyltransferase family protein [Ignavibacteria bacterium]